MGRFRRHHVIAAIIVLAGIMSIASVWLGFSSDRIRLVDSLFPFELSTASKAITFYSGAWLMTLGRGLWLRRRRAWNWSVVFLVVAVIGHIIKGFEIEEAAVLVILLGLLFAYRRDFFVSSGRIPAVTMVVATLGVLLSALIYFSFGAILLRHQFVSSPTPRMIVRSALSQTTYFGGSTLHPLTREARAYVVAASEWSALAFLIIAGLVFTPYLQRSEPSQEDFMTARTLVLAQGKDPSSYFALQGDKQFWFTRDRATVVVFRLAGSTAVVLGDPIGAFPEQAVKEFLDWSRRQGIEPIFTSLPGATLPWYTAVGYRTMKIAEEAMIVPKEFRLEGKRVEDIRHGKSRMVRLGAQYEWYRLNDLPDHVRDEIDGVYRQAMRDRQMNALHFSVNFYPLPEEHAAWAVICRSASGGPWGAVSLLPFAGQAGLVIEQMLRSPSAPNGMMEALVAEAIHGAAERGYSSFSLGGAPLADASSPEVDDLRSGIRQYFFKNLQSFYRYEPLFRFKDKFAPAWEPRYVAYPSVVALPRVGLALAEVHTGSSLLRVVQGQLGRWMKKPIGRQGAA